MKIASALLKFIMFCLLPVGGYASSDIEVEDAWVNEAPPTVSVLAGYATLINNSEKDVQLEAVTSPDFATIEIHQAIINDGMASMVKQDSLSLPANSAVLLKPGGLHLMLFQPVKALKSGDSVALKFMFSDKSTLTETVDVRRQQMHDHDDDHHHHHHH